MSGRATPSSRGTRALAALEGQPSGLLTPEIARLLGEYPWALVEIARALRQHEARGRVTRTQPGPGTTVRWKITERGQEHLAVTAARI